MKSLKTSLFLLITAALFLTSCTVEKRMHMSGYHIEWNNSKYTMNKIPSVETEQLANIEPKQFNAVTQGLNVNNTATEAPILFASSDKSVPAANTNIKSLSKSIEEASIKSQSELEKVVKNSSSNVWEQIIAANQATTVKPAPAPVALAASGKSQIIALILVVFVGVLGIHRFYLGYTGIGILMLLTGGVCGILALIDLIRIITGDLKPKDGRYTETL